VLPMQEFCSGSWWMRILIVAAACASEPAAGAEGAPPLPGDIVRGWQPEPVEATTLERDGSERSDGAGPWRNLPFAMTEGEKRSLLHLRAIAKSFSERVQDMATPGKEDSSIASLMLREFLAEARYQGWSVFYQEYLLSVWHFLTSDEAKGRRHLLRALKRAPVVLVRRYSFEDGTPARGFVLPLAEVACAHVTEHRLDLSATIAFPRLVTDDDGCVYIPLYGTVFRLESMRPPPGFSAKTASLEWFQSRGKAAFLPAVTLVCHDERTLELAHLAADSRPDVRRDAISRMHLLSRRIDRDETEMKRSAFDPEVHGLLPVLIRVSSTDADEDNRIAAIAALADTRDIEAMLAIRARIGDASPAVRFHAGCFLSEFGDYSGRGEVWSELGRLDQANTKEGAEWFTRAERALSAIGRMGTGYDFGAAPPNPASLSDPADRERARTRYRELVALYTELSSIEAALSNESKAPEKPPQRPVRAPHPPTAGDPLQSKPLERWVKELRDGDIMTSIEAVAVLKRAGSAAAPALPQLIDALGDATAHVCDGAAQVIGSIGPAGDAAVPALLRLLCPPWKNERGEAPPGGNQLVALSAADALGKIGGAALPGLVEALNSQDEWTRAVAARGLRYAVTQGSTSAPHLVGTLKDPSRFVWRNAARTLRRLGASAVPALAEGLNGNDELVSREGLEWPRGGSFTFGEEVVAEENAKDETDLWQPEASTVHELIARILAEIGPAASGALPALKALRKAAEEGDETEEVFSAACEAIHKIAGS
jgi:HEAT repeat protein